MPVLQLAVPSPSAAEDPKMALSRGILVLSAGVLHAMACESSKSFDQVTCWLLFLFPSQVCPEGLNSTLKNPRGPSKRDCLVAPLVA